MRWLFNSLMIWGAVLGYLIFSGIGGIQDTWRHKDPGPVFYEQPDRVETVKESQYKRHEYTKNGILLITGVIMWIIVAKSSRNKSNTKTDDTTFSNNDRLQD